MNDNTCHCAKYDRSPVIIASGICVICNPGPYQHRKHESEHDSEPAWSWAKEEYREDTRKAELDGPRR